MDRLNFADIDNDGDLDVFIGVYANQYPVLYTNTGDAQNPVFLNAATYFWDQNISFIESLVLKDIDGDGDLDALLNGNRYFENQGTVTSPSFVEITGNSNPFENINGLFYKLPDLIDLDADSDFDLLFGNNAGIIKYYKNTGTVNSAIFENTSGGIDSTYYAVMPDFVDIDNDGDFDMFVGIYNETAGAMKYAYYKNTGTAETPVYEKQAWADNPLQAIESSSYAPVLKFADIDNDGDQDVFTGGYFSQIRYFENTGTADNAVFTEQTGVNNPLDVLSSSYYLFDYDFTDIDNDGDLDFFYSNEYYNNEILFLRNTGSNSSPTFVSEASPVTLPETWIYLFPEFADIDNDGDYDMLAGGYDDDLEQGQVFYAENKGTADAPDFEAQYGDLNPLNLTMYIPGISLVDVDNDGDQDAFIGTLGGTVHYFKNKTISVGVDALDKNTLSVYPNPASDEIKLDLSSFNQKEVGVSIIDIPGKTIAVFNMKNTNTIDVSTFKSCIYFIKASDLQHSETAKLIVK